MIFWKGERMDHSFEAEASAKAESPLEAKVSATSTSGEGVDQRAPSDALTPDRPSPREGEAVDPGKQEGSSTEPVAEAEIVPADKRWRFLVLTVAGLVVLAGFGGLWALHRSLKSLDHRDPDQLRQAVCQLQEMIAWIACLGGVGFLGAAGWLFRLGWKINRSGQYPPPGMKVLRTVPVRRGQAALVRADIALVGAAVLGAVGTVGMVWLYQTAVDLLQSLLPGP